MDIPVDAERFAAIAAREAEPLRPWVDTPNGRRPAENDQQCDDAGVPIWTVEVMIPGRRTTIAQVRIASRTCPAVEALAPVIFERLTVSTRVKDGREVCYWDAAGVAGTPAARAVRDAS